MTKLYYNVDVDRRQLLAPANNAPLTSAALRLVARDQFILCLSFVRQTGGEWVAAALDAGTQIRLGLKAVGSLFGADYLAFSDVDQVNIQGDWDDAALEDGKVSIRVDLNTEPVEGLFDDSDEDADCILEVEALDALLNATTIVQQDVSLKPDVIRANATPPEEGQPDYLTTATGVLATQVVIPAGKRLVISEAGNITVEDLP